MPRFRVLTAGLGLLALAPAADAQASSARWTCEASALRLTLLGTTLEPAVANVGPAPLTCRPDAVRVADTSPLPILLTASAVTAATAVQGPETGPVAAQQVLATGGIGALRLGLPAGDGTVPTELLTAETLSSAVAGGCADGAPRLTGASRVGGLRVLGRNVTTGGAGAAPLDLAVPGTGLRLRVARGEQVRTGGRLVQRALHAELTLGGREVLDLVAGEAAAGADAVACPGREPAQATDPRLLVTSITTRRSRVTIRGRVVGPLAPRAADRRITVSRRVRGGRWVAAGHGLPRRGGRFAITVPAPHGARATVLRLRAKVRATARSRKVVTTSTLPRTVDLRP